LDDEVSHFSHLPPRQPFRFGRDVVKKLVICNRSPQVQFEDATAA
jgi:hypothetical protein